MSLARHSLQRGFTLLELSIVLAIISLIAGAGMNMASGALKAADRITTQERLNTIKLALDTYAKDYGYLPCPADRTLTPANANFGVSAHTAGTVTCVASAPGVVNNGPNVVWLGSVPVRTLGLPDNYAGDSWGNKLSYAVANNQTSNPINYQQGGQIYIRYGNLTTWYAETLPRGSNPFTSVADNGSGVARLTMPFTNAPATGTIVYMVGSVYKGSYIATFIDTTHFDLQGSTYTTTDSGTFVYQAAGKNASYAVVSHGPDGRGAYPLNSATIPSTKLCNTSATANSSPAPCTSNANMNCIDIENCNDDRYFFDTTYNDGAQDTLYFDDYIVWSSADLSSPPVNPSLYSSCPVAVGACENWCATCTVNYPGGGATAPPASITSNAFLFKKVLTSDSTTCSAACFWGGVTASGYIKAP